MFFKKNDGTGILVSNKRFGELEKRAVAFALDLNKGDKVLDVGAGRGDFGLVCAFLKKKVFVFDKNIFWGGRVAKRIFDLDLAFVKSDVASLNYKDFPDSVSVVYSARFLHYLKYKEARGLLKILKRKMKAGGRLYFSVSGSDSEIGEYFKHAGGVEKRWGKLSEEGQEKFEISEPVCLYSKKELEVLFGEFFEVLELWESEFGNVFVVAVRK